MKRDFDILLAASPNDRRDEFIATSQRLGTAAQNIEKDFWVCWTIGHTRDGATVPFSTPLLDVANSPALRTRGLESRRLFNSRMYSLCHRNISQHVVLQAHRIDWSTRIGVSSNCPNAL